MSQFTKNVLKAIHKGAKVSDTDIKLMADEILTLRELKAEREKDYRKAADEIERQSQEIARLNKGIIVLSELIAELQTSGDQNDG